MNHQSPMSTENQIIRDSEQIRRLIIETAYKSGQSAHIGGALSMVELLSYLYSEFLNHDPSNPTWSERDVFILSKGHACLGYFATLCHYGYFDKEVLGTFQLDGSDLIAHPVKNLDLGIESSNGSLGQGLSFGMGLAIGFKKLKQDRKVVVMLGDGECNEGSIWETAASASEQKVDNLIAILDENGFRNDGPNLTYQKSSSLKKIWKSFGWNVINLDGNCPNEVVDAFNQIDPKNNMPTILVAKTIKGKGIDFMENNNDWHHNRITESTYNQITGQEKDS